MADDFVRDMQFEYGVVQRVSPLIRRVVSNNPGPFTFRGTGVYIVGEGDVALLDPGPDMPGQLDMLKDVLGAERVPHILLTHGHLDHSPMARPLAAITGAKVYGAGVKIVLGPTGEEGDDPSLSPDVTLSDGAVIEGKGWTLRAITTPGHASDHVCFALDQEKACFTGDHIMGWSTSVISPPDGNMQAYLDSLRKIEAMDFDILWPTHGPPIHQPKRFINGLIKHREMREHQIAAQLRNGPKRIPDIVAALYAGVDKSLHPAANRSILAHMIRMVGDGRVAASGAVDLTSTYDLNPNRG
jgi:glyoxylase-like metal-dependent hydrolase (beta-lactamase superfamily II)